VQYYDGAAWATLAPAPAVSSGLTFILSTTFSAAAVLTMANVFSSTYDNYLVIVSNLIASADAGEARVRFGTSGSQFTGANYDFSITATNNGAAYNSQGLDDTHLKMIGSYVGNVEPSALTITINSPNLAQETTVTATNFGNRNTVLASEAFAGVLNTTTQYTDFFLSTSGGPTHTATITVYGYSKS